MRKIAIVTSGYLPVPATKGGAVEALDEYLVQQNEALGALDLTVYSSFEENAEKMASTYQHTKVEFVKTPGLIQAMDRVVYFLAKNILKKKKHLSYRYILQRLHFQGKVGKALATSSFDKVVLENNATLYRVIAKYGNREKYKGRVVLHLHNLVTNDFGYGDVIQETSQVLGVSKYINQTLKERFPALKEESFSVLRNVVDRNIFNGEITSDERHELRAKYGIAEGEQMILFAGRMDEEKGIRELLQAFKIAKIQQAKLLIIGGYFFDSDMLSEYEVELRELASDLGDKVIFTGFIPHKELGDVYAAADFTVLPSIWEDPAPLTVIEALSSGSPLITTDSGGIPEYAPENGSIIIERKGDWVVQLAEEMQKLSEDAEKRKIMREINKEWTKAWDVPEFYRNFVQLLS
ncbi:MAG: glycosyltransferase family 4 protein [Streptococcaceae bacterium]|jgi:glycosyltransferase involved in cell wall biosynthesis|nr:glycosyltransferase family 4 protein [Streptococcaceae bacterium]